MTQLCTTLVFFAAAVSFVLASVSNELITTKHLIIRREAVLAKNAVREITIETSQDKVQLASMTNDLMFTFAYAANAINSVVPNILSEEEQRAATLAATTLSDCVHILQECFSAELGPMKEVLAAALEVLNKNVAKFDKEFRGNFDYFTRCQKDREHNIVISSLYKLKYPAQFFNQSNEELVKEMNISLVQFTKAVESLAIKKEATRELFRRMVQMLFTYRGRVVYRIQNWVDINRNRTEDVKILEKFIESMIVLFNGRNLPADRNNGVASVKVEMVRMYRSMVKLGTKLVKIKYPDNTGGEELIRPFLFDLVMIGRAYAENLEAIVSTK